MLSRSFSSSQYLLTGIFRTTLLHSMSVSSEVTALSWPQGREYVYATAGNQVRLIIYKIHFVSSWLTISLMYFCQIVRLPLEMCSSSVTCNSCVTNGDPLCGWCSVEGKCSRRTQCQNNNDTRRYLPQGEQSNCCDIVMIDPLPFVTELQSVSYLVSSGPS